MSVDGSQSSTHLDALVSTLEEAVLFLNEDAVVVRLSVGANRWLDGVNILGQSIHKVLPQTVVADLTDILDKAAIEGTQHLEQLVRPDAAPLLQASGLTDPLWFKVMITRAPDGWVVMLRDVTEQKRMSRSVGGHSQRDMLTGAYNQRTMMPVIAQAIAQAQRYDWICSLLVIDVDEMHRINDSFGWDTGDQVLQQLVRELERMKRTADFLARISDDKLALFLPETNQQQALLAAERVLRAAREQVFTVDGQQVSYTVSIGAATLQGPDDNAETMLARAENHLLIAYQSGGNRAEGEA